MIEQGNYTTEGHQVQFEKELQEDYGYELTEEFKKGLELSVKRYRLGLVFLFSFGQGLLSLSFKFSQLIMSTTLLTLSPR